MGQCLEPRGGSEAAGGGQAVPAGPGQAQRHFLPQPAVPQGHHGQSKSKINLCTLSPPSNDLTSQLGFFYNMCGSKQWKDTGARRPGDTICCEVSPDMHAMFDV